MMLFLAALLTLAVINSVLLARVYYAMPLVELRRRARAGHDKRAAALYKMMAYSSSLLLLLWLKGTICASILLIWAARTSWWSAALAILLLSLLIFVGRNSRRVPAWQLRYAASVAPLAARVLGFMQPVVGRLSGRFKISHPHTLMYESEDLLNLLKVQARQTDNRLSESDLKTAHAALDFSSKTVGQTMLPRSKVKWVAASEVIGPMVTDELHKSGQTRFAVVKEISKTAEPGVVGSLYLQDLLDHLEDRGHIRDIMHPGAGTIDETAGLRDCLAQFLKSGQQLLVVKNNFQEIAGVITLEDVLAQILGQPPTPEHVAPQFKHPAKPAETPEQTDKKVLK